MTVPPHNACITYTSKQKALDTSNEPSQNQCGDKRRHCSAFSVAKTSILLGPSVPWSVSRNRVWFRVVLNCGGSSGISVRDWGVVGSGMLLDDFLTGVELGGLLVPVELEEEGRGELSSRFENERLGLGMSSVLLGGVYGLFGTYWFSLSSVFVLLGTYFEMVTVSSLDIAR